jgi:hypothetical protein
VRAAAIPGGICRAIASIACRCCTSIRAGAGLPMNVTGLATRRASLGACSGRSIARAAPSGRVSDRRMARWR